MWEVHKVIIVQPSKKRGPKLRIEIQALDLNCKKHNLKRGEEEKQCFLIYAIK